jgi:hypothetical protein
VGLRFGYLRDFSDSFLTAFYEVRGFVGDAKPLVLLGIYTPLAREYAAFVAWPSRRRVKAQDRYLPSF